MNPGVRLAKDVEIRGRVERLTLRVDAEDGLPSFEIGPVDHDLPVEPSGAQERGIQDVGPVRCGHQDHRRTLIEAVHLDQELVQRLLSLVVTAAEARASMAADRVDLVDEDDRRRAGLRLLEEVAHACRAHPHEHLDEVRAADREEGHARLAGDGTGEQRLAGPRRAEQQHSSRDLRTHGLELGRVLEVLLDLFQLLDGLVHTRDVFERGLGLVLAHRLMATATELHHAASAALRAVHHPQEQPREQQDREDVDQETDELVRFLCLGLRRHTRLSELGDDLIGGLRRVCDLVAWTRRRASLGSSGPPRGSPRS